MSCAACNRKSCSLCGEPTEKAVNHHTSYKNGLRIKVCEDCHNKIHGKWDAPSTFYPELTRREAEERFEIESRGNSPNDLWGNAT